MANRILQLRRKMSLGDKNAARKALQNFLSTTAVVGEPGIATYTDDGTEKSIVWY